MFMDEKKQSIMESWERLKSEIISYADKDGKIHGKEHDLPYRDRMSNFIRKVKAAGNLGPEFACFLSSDAIYKKLEEEDGIVLMDYKTDRIHEDAKAELTKKYQSQLGYYRTALEKLTGKPVKEVWFYAFGTGEDFMIE